MHKKNILQWFTLHIIQYVTKCISANKFPVYELDMYFIHEFCDS